MREKFRRIISGESFDNYGNTVDSGTGAIILSDQEKRRAEVARALSVKRIKTEISTGFEDFDSRVIVLRKTLAKAG